MTVAAGQAYYGLLRPAPPVPDVCGTQLKSPDRLGRNVRTPHFNRGVFCIYFKRIAEPLMIPGKAPLRSFFLLSIERGAQELCSEYAFDRNSEECRAKAEAA